MGKGMGLVVRSAIWMLLAIFFLIRDVARINAARHMGLQVTPWMWVQLLLWLAVLGFWAWMALRGWRTRTYQGYPAEPRA